MKKWAYAVLALIVIGLGFVPFGLIRDGGIYKVKLKVESASGRRIAAVSAESFGDEAEAADTLDVLAPPETRISSATQSPFAGEEMTVPVLFGMHVHSALFWTYETHRWQYEVIVVIVTYEGGERRGQLVRLPDLRTHERSLFVKFP